MIDTVITNVINDVPQGSILGPLLFLLYINDLPINVRHSKIALFADDAKCVKNVKSVASCIESQGDIHSILWWSQKWRMIFNISKCFIITFTRLKNPVSFNYSMNGVALKRVTEVQDLGVTLDSALQWNIHVKNIISKANRVSGLIKRTLGWHAPQHTKFILYSSLVGSILEYCSPL